MYADVIIDISHEQLDKTFQYAVPDELADVIELGMSVDIPFGAGNRQITGYVVGLGDKAAYPVEKIKYIKNIIPLMLLLSIVISPLFKLS